MRNLLKYMTEYRKECVFAPLFKLFEAGLDLLVPLLVSAIIDNGIRQSSSSYVIKLCILLIFLACIGLLAAITAQFFAAKAATGFAANLREAAMEKIHMLSYSALDSLGASRMITCMTSDINQVQSGVNLTLRLLLRSPLIVFGALLMAFLTDARSSLIFLLVIAILLLIVVIILAITVPMHKQTQKGMENITRTARENLTGVRVIRAFCAEQEETQTFQDQNHTLVKAQIAAGKITSLLNPLTLAVVNISVVALLYAGAIHINSGTLSQGSVVALYNYMSLILVELVKMANLIVNISKSLASADRVAAILQAQGSEERSSGIQNALEAGTVCFDHVSLTYSENSSESIQDISFKAEPGSTIGIIGGTGSGKTTLINLIPAFYEPTQGSVLIDSIDTREWSKEVLRNKIGIVPQKAVLFRGTIRSNLLWGNPEATESDLKEAIQTACAEDVVQSKEFGLDEPVQQNGSNFSGGQKQRLTIARALVKHPEFLILDDSSSALDYATDAALRKSLSGMKPAPTTFIVAQRASSVQHADQIIVLDDGKMVGKGSHEELLSTCPVYQEIYDSQFGGIQK